ncbi:glycoside hydrolase family 13 protein [soil metagenome]
MNWWDDAVGYEIYIRSFADGNGDGVGDFHGLTEGLDHLAWLGVDVVWVTPFFPSPQADFGYDVADYTDVDPTYGDLAAFDRFVARARALGLKVMIDIVPNHTSSDHQWFRQALADPAAPTRSHYLFRPPGPGGGPPNNWVSHFGGPAWTRDEKTGEFYCHLFLPEQPDLDWRSEAVREAFDAILTFWVDRGVEGFRIDVAHSLLKDEAFRDNPQILPLGSDATPSETFAAFEHRHDLDQVETKEIFRRWKDLPGFSDVALVGEVYLYDDHRSASYMGDGGLDLCLFFGLNRRQWDPTAFADEVKAWSEASPLGFAWTIASHDENRPPSRFGGGEVGRARALALWTAFASLPGMPFLFQGEELGLEDGFVAPEDSRDPVGREAYEESRDPCRTPMPWEPGPHSGFTDGPSTWLRSAPRADDETVAAQRADPGSHLHRFRRLLEVRRLVAELKRGKVEWLEAPPGVLAFRRDRVATVSNLTDHPVEVALPPGAWQVVYSSSPDEAAGGDRVPARSGRIHTTV